MQDAQSRVVEKASTEIKMENIVVLDRIPQEAQTSDFAGDDSPFSKLQINVASEAEIRSSKDDYVAYQAKFPFCP